MNKTIFRAIWIVVLCGVVVWYAGARGDELRIERKHRPPYSAGTGMVTTANSVTWNLTDLEADTDSCMFSSVFDMTNAEDAPRGVSVWLSWTGATGVDTNSVFNVTMYAHPADTSVAGYNSAFDNRLTLGAWQEAPNDTATIHCNNTAGGEALMFVKEAVSPYNAPIMLPRYVSVAVQKDGDGYFTAGTVTVYIYPER